MQSLQDSGVDKDMKASEWEPQCMMIFNVSMFQRRLSLRSLYSNLPKASKKRMVCERMDQLGTLHQDPEVIQ